MWGKNKNYLATTLHLSFWSYFTKGFSCVLRKTCHPGIYVINMTLRMFFPRIYSIHLQILIYMIYIYIHQIFPLLCFPIPDDSPLLIYGHVFKFSSVWQLTIKQASWYCLLQWCHSTLWKVIRPWTGENGIWSLQIFTIYKCRKTEQSSFFLLIIYITVKITPYNQWVIVSYSEVWVWNTQFVYQDDNDR